MKKLSILLLVVLLIASLFTSCSNSSNAPTDVLVDVKIEHESNSRSLSFAIDTSDEGLEWHYSATKVSEKEFKHGETADAKIPEGNTITLSQGTWDFGIWAIKDGKKVYSGTSKNVLIKKNIFESTVSVVIPVSSNTGDKGYIVFDNVTINLKTNDGNGVKVAPNYVSVDGVKKVGNNVTSQSIECSAGSHEVIVAYKDTEGILNDNETITVTVNYGRTTTISGSFDCSVPDEVVALNTTTNTTYDSFATALSQAFEGDTIILFKDVTGDEFSVTKSLTIEGNNHTLTDNTSGGIALGIDANGVTLTINDLTIDGVGECKKGFQVKKLDSGWNTANVTLNNCTIKNITHYAINLMPGTTVNMEINDSNISGWAAINAYGTGNKITVNNSTLEGINSQGLSDWNNFTTVCLEGDTTGHSTLGSSDYEVIINNSTIIAKQTTGNRQSAIGFNSNSKNSSVSLNNTTITLGDEDKCYFYYDNGTGNKIYINDDLVWESPEANCWYSNGPFNTNKTGGMITNLASPFNGGWMAAGEGIILEKDIVLTENIECQMTSGLFYLYLDNHTLTGGSIIIDEGVSVISDTANLSIFKSATEGMKITSTNNDGTYKYYVNSSV